MQRKSPLGSGMKVAKADGSATRITNVAAGVNPTDAVNVSQLGGLKNDIHNMNNRLGKVNRESSCRGCRC